MLRWNSDFRVFAPVAALCLAASLLLAGCAAPATVQTPRLRITNSGAETIRNLTVLFPEAEVAFGDVPPGTTTAYQHVPNGVYRYAAYRLEVNGEVVTQPVIDWLGEKPLDGDSFTYIIEFDPTVSQSWMVQLLDVTQD